MSRRPDAGKRREWNERFQRFKRSSQTVADFCRAEGVSQPSFYSWKRRLGGGDRRRRRVKRRHRSSQPANPGSGFRSVIVTPPTYAVSVKVRLPGGAVIELGDDPLVIERVVGQLLQQTGTRADGC